MTAASRWSEALQRWAIPEDILAGAAASPWEFSIDVFLEATRTALHDPLTPTHRQVTEALPERGVVLDVGCGTGAASLPVAPPASRIVAVDQDHRMLEALARLAEGRVGVETVEGRWPDVAGAVSEVDVAMSANVAYNVGDLDRFVQALTRVARRRVVLELTAVHPQAWLSPLWERFWGLSRPDRPVAGDAADVVTEAVGVRPQVLQWERARPLDYLGTDRLRWIGRRLCLPESAEKELAAALGSLPVPGPTRMVTLSWPGAAEGG